jgi:hypothetical protein
MRSWLLRASIRLCRPRAGKRRQSSSGAAGNTAGRLRGREGFTLCQTSGCRRHRAAPLRCKGASGAHARQRPSTVPNSRLASFKSGEGAVSCTWSPTENARFCSQWYPISENPDMCHPTLWRVRHGRSALRLCWQIDSRGDVPGNMRQFG